MDHLEGLNTQQKEAVLHTEGPLLIVAGAGAGKTKTITHRIAHLVDKGVPARHILAVTFTNKAAGEMRERVRKLVPEASGMPVVSTFHALGVRLLREFHAEAGLPRGFSIWDRDDSVRAVKGALERLGIENWTPRAILSGISREKGDGTSVAEYQAKARTFRERAVAQVWEIYEKLLKEEEALDFDDLLYRTLNMLRSSERVRSLLQNRWKYITIDEYQDTNKSQYLRGGRHRPEHLQLARRRHRAPARLRGELPRRTYDPARTELPIDFDHPYGGKFGHREEYAAHPQAALHREHGR